MQHLKGSRNLFESWNEVFNTNIKIVDDNFQQFVEGVVMIEYAILLHKDRAAEKPTSSQKNWWNFKEERTMAWWSGVWWHESTVKARDWGLKLVKMDEQLSMVRWSGVEGGVWWTIVKNTRRQRYKVEV
jgi:hypothetical protein